MVFRGNFASENFETGKVRTVYLTFALAVHIHEIMCKMLIPRLGSNLNITLWGHKYTNHVANFFQKFDPGYVVYVCPLLRILGIFQVGTFLNPTLPFPFTFLLYLTNLSENNRYQKLAV